MRLSFAVLAAFAFGIGCSSGGSDAPAASLDCAWLAGNNCWRSTLSQAASCLPPQGETGTFSADMTTCTYASGAVVTFDTALALPLPDDPVWGFTVTSGGQQCLRFHDAADGFTLTVDDQTVVEAAEGLTLVVSCPDHTTFASSNALDLLSCPADGGIGGLPGKAWSDTPTSVSFSLIGGGASASADIFSCRMP